MPEDALQLLGGQPATEPSPRVRLGSLDEHLTKALVQAGAALVRRIRMSPFAVFHETQGSGPSTSAATPLPDQPAFRVGE